MARQRKEVDLDLLQRLAERGCSQEEIAAMLRRSGIGMNVRTLKRRLEEAVYRTAWDEAAAVGRVNLRSRMFNLAMQNGNLNVAQRSCEFLLERWVGMTAKAAIQLSGENGGPVQLVITQADSRL